MALSESQVDNVNEYIYTEYSSGDSNKIKSKQYQEENNNDIDEISKDLSEMGCIVDTVKRPPNICIETCVYEESDSDDDNDQEIVNVSKNNENILNNDEINYSDEFDEDTNSEVEEINNENKTNLDQTSSTVVVEKPSLKLSNSSSTFSNKPQSMSRRSSDFSLSLSQSRRKNMSFSNDRLREIERHNHILLNKILSARNKKKSTIPPRDQSVRKPVPSAAVHRKAQQRKIDYENMILLKKIQCAKSSSCSIRR